MLSLFYYFSCLQMTFAAATIHQDKQQYFDMFETITHDTGLEARLRAMFVTRHEEKEDAEDRAKVKQAMIEAKEKPGISFSDYKKKHGL